MDGNDKSIVSGLLESESLVGSLGAEEEEGVTLVFEEVEGEEEKFGKLGKG